MNVKCQFSDNENLGIGWDNLKDNPECQVIGIDVSKCSSIDLNLLDEMQYIKTKNGEFVKKRPDGDWVHIEFPNMTPEKMDHMFNAGFEMLKAGISFDTGYNFVTNTRDWEFDYSLKGAKIEVV